MACCELCVVRVVELILVVRDFDPAGWLFASRRCPRRRDGLCSELASIGFYTREGVMSYGVKSKKITKGSAPPGVTDPKERAPRADRPFQFPSPHPLTPRIATPHTMLSWTVDTLRCHWHAGRAVLAELLAPWDLAHLSCPGRAHHAHEPLLPEASEIESSGESHTPERKRKRNAPLILFDPLGTTTSPPARRRARSLAAGVVFFFVFFVFFPWLARSLSHPRKLFISNTTVHAVHFGPLCAGLSPIAVAAVHRRPARRRPPLFPTGETVDAYRRRRLPRLLLHVLAPKRPS